MRLKGQKKRGLTRNTKPTFSLKILKKKKKNPGRLEHEQQESKLKVYMIKYYLQGCYSKRSFCRGKNK